MTSRWIDCVSEHRKRARGTKIAIIGLGVALAIGSSLQAASFAFQSKVPSIALQIDPNNPVALVRKARNNLAAGTSDGDNASETLQAARQSIAANPLNADAFSLYGLITMANSDTKTVSRQMTMADRLSRRDSATQLFLIEEAVRRNDVAAALRHYDAALRVRSSLRASLFPVLASALRESAIRKRFLPYMSSSTPWLEPFLRYAIVEGEYPASIAALALEAGGFPDSESFARRTEELLRVLITKNEYGLALQIFEKIGDGDPAILTDGRFTAANTDQRFAPFTWQIDTHGGIDPIFVTNASDALELEVRLDAGFTGNVLRKVFALPPGSYALAASTESEGNSAEGTVGWVMSCVSNSGSREILRESQDLLDQGSFETSFEVPEGCPFQMLQLSARTSAGLGDIVFVVGSPEISKR